jgi:signal transduction histidine kinase/Tfp pilus assembly protein PilF
MIYSRYARVAILLCVFSLTKAQAQNQFQQKVDSIFSLIKNHAVGDSVWFQLQSDYMFQLRKYGKHNEIDKVASYCLRVADSVDSDRGRFFGFKWKATAWYYTSVKIDSAIAMMEKSRAIAEKKGWKKEWTDQLCNLGLAYLRKGDYTHAKSTYLQAVKMAQELNHQSAYAAANVGLGNLYYLQLSDYNTALQYYTKAAEYTTVHKTSSLTNIGLCFRSLKEYDQAMHYFNLAIRESFVRTEVSIRASVYNSKGGSFLEINKPDSALHSYEQALAEARKASLRFEESVSLIGLGRVNAFYKRYATALDYYLRATRTMEEINYVEFQKECAYRTAMVYKEMNNIKQEKLYLRKALSYSPKYDKPIHKQVLEELVALSEREKEYQAALDYQKQIGVLQDSTFNEQKVREAIRMEGKYEVEMGKKEIETLEAKNKLTEAELARTEFNRKILIASVLVLVLVVMLTVYAYWVKKNSNEKLRKQNILIQQQQEELRASMESQQAMQAQLIHSEKMSSLGRMTAGIAHEINNPMNFISGGIEALKQSYEEVLAKDVAYQELKEETSLIFKAVQNGVDRVTRIVKSLNAFSDMQTDGYLVMSLQEILDMALTVTNKNLEMQQVKVIRHFEPGLRIQANPSQLSLVFVNMIENAIHAMEGNTGEKNLTITSGLLNGQVQVTITDNGSGISEEAKSRLFDPFFTTKPVGKGAGLGLSVCFGIIEKHKGKITFDSEAGKGASFHVTLVAAN